VLPFSGANDGGSVVGADDPVATQRGDGLLIEFDHVSADYLPAIGVRLLDGRWFHDDDLSSNLEVVIINDARAKKLWPGQSAIGKEICLNCYGANFRERRRVGGVVRSVRPTAWTTPTTLQVYKTAHAYECADFVVVRTSRPASEMTRPVRRAPVDPKQPVFLSVPMSQLIAHSVADRRFIVLLIALTGSLALLLAAAGIYGVISYTTSLRTSETGQLMALGAAQRTSPDVSRRLAAGGHLEGHRYRCSPCHHPRARQCSSGPVRRSAADDFGRCAAADHLGAGVLDPARCAKTSPSLFPQRVHGIELSSAPGRKEARRDCNRR
jgi:hypothetical protein